MIAKFTHKGEPESVRLMVHFHGWLYWAKPGGRAYFTAAFTTLAEAMKYMRRHRPNVEFEEGA